jgi:hypothetical protein
MTVGGTGGGIIRRGMTATARHKEISWGNKYSDRVLTMGGYVCRFCKCDCENGNGSMSLEISTRNRKIIIYVCRECCSRLEENTIILCQCGNIQLNKDANMGGELRIVTHCSLCYKVQTACL